MNWELIQLIRRIRKIEFDIRRTYTSGRFRERVYDKVNSEMDRIAKSPTEQRTRDILDRVLSILRSCGSDPNVLQYIQSKEFLDRERQDCSQVNISEDELDSMIQVANSASSNDGADTKLQDYVPRNAQGLLSTLASLNDEAKTDIQAAKDKPRKVKKPDKKDSQKRYGPRFLGWVVAILNVVGFFGLRLMDDVVLASELDSFAKASVEMGIRAAKGSGQTKDS